VLDAADDRDEQQRNEKAAAALELLGRIGRE
jgi:hypothetical protein